MFGLHKKYKISIVLSSLRFALNSEGFEKVFSAQII